MPQPFSQLTSAIASHSIKHVYNIKNRNQQNQQQAANQFRRSSSSSSSDSSSSLSSSLTSIATTITTQPEPSSMASLMSLPTLQQVNQVRDAWEKVCERRHRKDHPSVSSAHAFGLVFYKALFEMDPSLKFKFGNVIRQARVLAEIMSYLTRSPSIKGETGSLKDLNAINRSNSKRSTPSVHDHEDHSNLCAVHAAAAAAAANATANAYAGMRNHRPAPTQRHSHSDYQPVPIPPPSPTSPTYHSMESKQFDDDICPFHQQEQEEKYQQQLLLQQQHQEELDKQRHSIQQDLQNQLERKMAHQQQEENKWFAYKLREVGIQYVEEYDLVPENLDVFTPALISALKSRLHDEFTPMMQEAWSKVCQFTFYHMKMGIEAHAAYHRRARRLSSGSYCSVEAGETDGVCTIQ